MYSTTVVPKRFLIRGELCLFYRTEFKHPNICLPLRILFTISSEFSPWLFISTSKYVVNCFACLMLVVFPKMIWNFRSVLIVIYLVLLKFKILLEPK